MIIDCGRDLSKSSSHAIFQIEICKEWETFFTFLGSNSIFLPKMLLLMIVL